MRGSVSKSGKPCAKLMERSGPLRARFNRVISRMTDSVKLWALSERRSVARIGALQSDLGARARVAAFGHLEAALPAPTHVARRERGGDLLYRRVLAEGDHVPRHHLFDRDHWVSSVATVSRFALPPLRIRPMRPAPSFPAMYAASVRAPVGSSARCSRVQARVTAEAISSSVTVTTSSTSP